MAFYSPLHSLILSWSVFHLLGPSWKAEFQLRKSKWNFSSSVIISAFIRWDSFKWVKFPSSVTWLSWIQFVKRKWYVIQPCLVFIICQNDELGLQNLLLVVTSELFFTVLGVEVEGPLINSLYTHGLYRIDTFESVAVLLFDIQIVLSWASGGSF